MTDEENEKYAQAEEWCRWSEAFMIKAQKLAEDKEISEIDRGIAFEKMQTHLTTNLLHAAGLTDYNLE